MKTIKEKFKEFRMRKGYLKFTADIGVILEKLFGRFWWYSLVHEKNTAISNTYHNLCLGVIIKEKYNFLDAFCDAFFKYCSFIVRYFIFFKFIKRVEEKELFVTYYGMLSFLKTVDNKYLYIPQRKDWKKIRKEKGCYVFDNFLSFIDFIYAIFIYFKITFTFIFNRKHIKNLFDYHASLNFILFNMYNLCKKDLYRSFAGDVLIEGIFYDCIFNRLSKKIKNKGKLEKKIIYVFEGRSWEKALCYYFTKSGRFVEKIGVVCSAISDNNLQFFYHSIDVGKMPLPEYIGVPGEILKEKLGKVYNDASVFILGSNRVFHGNEINCEEIKIKKLLIILGSNDKQNIELLDFIKSHMSGNITVKKHPDSKLTNEEIGLKIETEIILYDKKAVIAVSSTVTFDAISYCIPIIVPKLKHYVDFIPIPDTYKGQKFCYRVDEGFDLMLAIDQIEETELNFNICNEYINKYFTYKSREEMRQIIDSIC